MGAPNSLVIGGTGPTGHLVVLGLLERGHRVTMVHSGKREIPEIPDEVEHIHTDAYDADALAAALGDRSFAVCAAMYGRLRRIAELMKGRCEQFISVGGVPAYKGFSHPWLFDPPGLPVPTPEDGPLVDDPAQDEKGFRIVKTEEAVFANHPRAAHFRYPYVYGKYQMLPREWCIVRRVLDGRRRIILPDGGLTLHHYGYAENLAHALLLAVDQPDAAAGQIYTGADAEVLSLAQVVTIVSRALGSELEIVSMPWELAKPARPLIALPLTTHRVFDMTKLRTQLGYRDKVKPAEALARTAHWLRDNPPPPGGQEEMTLQDPFDYEAEDRLMDAWQAALAGMPDVEFTQEPGFTLSYSGPGGRPRSQKTFQP